MKGPTMQCSVVAVRSKWNPWNTLGFFVGLEF